MGYYTEFLISAHGPSADEAIDALQTTSGYSWDGELLQDAKWYDWDKNLASVSAAFPDVLFILDGMGEENPDIWRAWAMAGRVEQVTATILAPQPDWVSGKHSLSRKADRS